MSLQNYSSSSGRSVVLLYVQGRWICSLTIYHTASIVERVTDVSSTDDLIRQTAKRSVFTADELRAWGPSVASPVKMIDFLLAGHSEPPVPLNVLLADQVFSTQPPQSISELSEDRYARLKSYIKLGF